MKKIAAAKARALRQRLEEVVRLQASLRAEEEQIREQLSQLEGKAATDT